MNHRTDENRARLMMFALAHGKTPDHGGWSAEAERTLDIAAEALPTIATRVWVGVDEHGRTVEVAE